MRWPWRQRSPEERAEAREERAERREARQAEREASRHDRAVSGLLRLVVSLWGAARTSPAVRLALVTLVSALLGSGLVSEGLVDLLLALPVPADAPSMGALTDTAIPPTL